MKCHAYFHAVRTLQDIRPLTKMAVPEDFVVRVPTTFRPRDRTPVNER